MQQSPFFFRSNIPLFPPSPPSNPRNPTTICYNSSSGYPFVCKINFLPFFPPPPSSPLPLPLPRPPLVFDKPSSHHLSPLVIIIVAILTSAFLLVSYYAVIAKYFSNRNNPGGSDAPPIEIHEDRDQTPNPMDLIWYVRTIGLDESVINSITVCKYKRGDGLIEGTECSVCLNDFREDEDLRLLPKCSHAFHLPCIDTWLKSHKNCPLCRANVVSNPASSPSTEPSSIATDSVEESQVGDSQSRIEFGSSRSNRVIGSGNFGDVDAAELGDLNSPRVNCGFRAQSDLIDNHQWRDSAIAVIDDGIQPVRRSFSMDSSAAAMVVISMANLQSMDSEGSSTSFEAHSAGNKKLNFDKPSDVKRIVSKQGWNQGMLKTVGNCSKRLQKGPILMKRSFSVSGKFFSARSGRSQNAVLPL